MTVPARRSAVAALRCVALLLMLSTAAAQAEETIEIDGAWIRHTPGDLPMAGYFRLHNGSGRDRQLIGAASPAFGAAHMHETVNDGDMAGMRPLDAVAVPAGGVVAFRPGGLHLMLTQRTQPLQVDDEVPVTLEFADGTNRAVRFTVKPTWQE